MTDSRIDIADCDDIHRVNAKSDFDFILKLFCGCAKDGGEPQEIGWPGFDWTARFWTWSPANAYTVSCIGGVCTNCFNDNGRIHAVFDNHRLSKGAETAPDEPMAAMADKVLGLRLAVEGQPGIVDQSFGGRLPYTDLLNLLRNNVRADLPYCYAVRHALDSVMLAGADAYLCSDGFFSEEGGEHGFTDFGDRWVIYYFRNADYLLTAPTPCLEAVALNGRPQFSLAGTEMSSLRSYTEEEYGLEAGLTSMGSALTEIHLAGVVGTKVVASTTKTMSLSLPELARNESRLVYGSELRSVRLPSLTHLSDNLCFISQKLVSVILPELVSASASVIDQCNAARRIYAPKLQTIQGRGGAFANNSAALTELTLPSLETISGGSVAASCPALTELSLPSLTIWGYPSGEFYMLTGIRGIKADIHVRVPRLERLGCYVINGNLDEFDKDIHIHFGAPQGGVLNVRANYSASHIFVSVEPGFRSSLSISQLTAMTAEMLREIISNLADNTDNATIPVRLGAANLAKLTEEDIALATAKNYTLS